MSYVGNTVQNQGFTPAVDFFSGNGSTTAFTLSRPVASVYQMLVNVANVDQNPGSAYTVSGSTITFSSAPPSGTNNIWVEYTSLITQIIAPSPGTVGTSQLASSTGSGSVVLGTSPTITSPTISGGTISNLAGNLTFASGTNGVVFNNSSASVNSTLNDYETGTWTPTLTAGTGSFTLSTTSGSYTKIGNMVTVNMLINFASTSSASNVTITNLPFSQASGNNSSGILRENAITGYFWGLSAGSGTSIIFWRYDNSNTLPSGTPHFTGSFTYVATF